MAPTWKAKRQHIDENSLAQARRPPAENVVTVEELACERLFTLRKIAAVDGSINLSEARRGRELYVCCLHGAFVPRLARGTVGPLCSNAARFYSGHTRCLSLVRLQRCAAVTRVRAHALASERER